MNPLRHLGLFCLSMAALGFIGGCAKKGTQVGRQAQRDEPQLAASDQTNRVLNIQDKVNALEADAAALPGGGRGPREADMAHRKLMQQVFGDLTQVLPLIEGEYKNGEFRQGMRILESSRQQLAGGSLDLAAEPTIGQGVRAALRLLENLNAMVFANDPEITKRIDALKQKVDELDSASGGMNRVVAAQSMRSAADVLQQMAGVLADRAGIDARPTTATTRSDRTAMR